MKDVRVTAVQLDARRRREGRLDVELLADVPIRCAGGDAREHGAARVVERVARAREPERVVAAGERELGCGLNFEARARVMNVLPAHLVGQPVLVVPVG